MKKMKKGFTLVELIVVIAIIGTLAAIIIPSIMGFVHESRVKTDIANSKRLYEAVEQLIIEDDAAYASMHKYNTTKYNVVVNTSNGTESYRLVVIARLGGKKGIPNTPSNAIQHGNNEAQGFAQALTERIKRNVVGSSSDVLIPLKAKTINGRDVNAWEICVRLDEKGKETDKVEIWAFDRNNTEAGEGISNWRPLYRVYPGTCLEYEEES